MRHETAAVSLSRRIDEVARHIERAEIVEVVVAASGKAHELLGLMRQREQALPETNWNNAVVRAMHDKNGQGNPRDTPVGMELIAHQQAHRDEPEQRAGNIHGGGIVFGVRKSRRVRRRPPQRRNWNSMERCFKNKKARPPP
jgi:hypothetical protein